MAVFDPANAEMSGICAYLNCDYASLEAIISAWLDQLQQEQPRDFCLAAAAPPAAELVTMVNVDWSFSCRDIAARFGFERVHWLNDFQANAHALPYLGADDSVTIAAGAARPQGKLAVMGPGTGLGGAALEWVGDRPIASNSEPGHMGLAPANDLELEIMRRLIPAQGEIYAEYLVSGPGLVRLYRIIAEIYGDTPQALSPAEISQRAIDASDDSCRQALATFCGLLGSACGDFLLARGAYGGLFLAGGIVPSMLDFLRASSFLERLRGKGAMTEHLAQVPVKLITLPHPGLLGAAHAPLA
jgi:glucokinase